MRKGLDPVVLLMGTLGLGALFLLAGVAHFVMERSAEAASEVNPSLFVGAAGGPRRLVVDGALDPKGYEQLTVTNAAVTELTVPAGAHLAYIQTEDNNLRWRDDGTPPTTAVGVVLYAGGGMWYDGDIYAFEMTAVAGDTTVNVSYYGL